MLVIMIWTCGYHADISPRSKLLFLFQRRTCPWRPGSPPPPPAMTRPASTAAPRLGRGCTGPRSRRGDTGTRTCTPSPDTRAGAREARHTASTRAPRASQWTSPPQTQAWDQTRSDVSTCHNLLLFTTQGKWLSADAFDVWPKYVYFSEWGIVRAIRLWHCHYHPAIARPVKYLRNFTFYFNFISEFHSRQAISSPGQMTKRGAEFHTLQILFYQKCCCNPHHSSAFVSLVFLYRFWKSAGQRTDQTVETWYSFKHER